MTLEKARKRLLSVMASRAVVTFVVPARPTSYLVVRDTPKGQTIRRVDLR